MAVSKSCMTDNQRGFEQVSELAHTVVYTQQCSDKTQQDKGQTQVDLHKLSAQSCIGGAGNHDYQEKAIFESSHNVKRGMTKMFFYDD